MPPPRIKGTHIVLRAPREQDVSERLALGRNPEIVRMFGDSTEQRKKDVG